MLKWIWFDLDDTLYDFSGASQRATNEALEFLASSLAPEDAALRERYRNILSIQVGSAFCDGRQSLDYRRERFRYAIMDSKIRDHNSGALVEEAVEIYERRFMAEAALKEGAASSLSLLSSQGYQLAILSDAPEDAQRRILKKLQLEAYVRALFTSGKTGKSKMNGLLSIALETLRIQANEVVMIGDAWDRDIIPALELGIKAIWFNDREKARKTMSCEIKSLQEIPGLIRNIFGPRNSTASD